MVLPLIMVAHLIHLETLQKVGLFFVFSLVLIDMSFDIIRTVNSISPALSYMTNLNAIWTVLEPTIAVIVCALPHYKSLVSGSKRRSESQASWPTFSTSAGLRFKSVPSVIELTSTSSRAHTTNYDVS
jgi:hypothetical protein